MLRHMGAREARQKFSEMLGRVRYGGETVILESSGKPVAAVVPLDLYHELIAERDAQSAVIDRVRARMPRVRVDEAEREIEEVVAEVRSQRAAGRT